MNVLIDGRALVGHRTGIGVHTAEIARRLAIDPPPMIAAHAEIADREGLEACRFRVDAAPNGILWQQFVLPRIAGDGVLWGPHGTIPLALKIPAVVTLHDFTAITMPGRHRLKTIASFDLFIGASLARASRIAAVSRAVAEEAVRGFAVPRRRIALVPNGVDAFFSPSQDAGDADGRAESDGEGGYILFVGTLEPRKGLDDLLAAWESLPRPRPRLVICGGEGWGARIAQRDGVETTGYVDRQRLRALYRGARVFVYPSRHEGFGIPPLEAMACGAAVIATRTGAIPDYAEGAAVLIEPGDRQALHDALVRLLRDGPLRRELRLRAAERASHYRWEASAATMTALLEEAARG